MKSTTVKWNPPTAEELPCNWSVHAMRYAPASYGDDGGAYKSRVGCTQQNQGLHKKVGLFLLEAIATNSSI